MDTRQLYNQKEKQKTDIIPINIFNLMTHTKIGFCLSLIFMLSGFSCSRSIVRVPEVHTEEKTKVMTDSIYIHDSVFVMQKGDTIYISKTRYRDRIKATTDTIKQTDSVPYPVEVIKEIHRANKYERFTSWAFPLVALLVIAFIFFKIRKFISAIKG